MKVLVSREEVPGQDGLPVIPEIDAPEPTRIEGQNGIGKTLLVHLLELISGRQPYASKPDLWLSLRNGLPILSITVSGLRSGQDLVAELNPRTWPEAPVEVDNWLGEVRLGGHQRSPQEVGQVFEVTRFAGNEDLGSAITEELRGEHARIVAASGLIKNRIRELQVKLGPLVDLLDSQHPDRLAGLHEAASEAQRRLDEKEAELSEARERQRKLERALRVRQLLSPQEPTDGGLSRVDQLSQQLTGLKQKAEDIGRRLEELLKTIEGRGKVEAELAKAERTHRTREQRLQARDAELLSALAECGLTSEPNGHELKRLLDDQERTALELEARRDEADASKRTRSLIGDLLPPIQTAVEDGLADQTVAEYDSAKVSVGELRDGLSTSAVSGF